MTDKKTYTSTWINIKGKIKWAKVYEPDEFRGAERWTLNIYPDSPQEWDKFKASGIQREVKKDADGEYFPITRPTFKLFGKRLTNFTPPIIYNKDGEAIVKYVNDDGEIVRTYEGDKEPKRVGEPVLIGNGSTVLVNICVFNTQMGKGSRLESVKILDLLEYRPQEAPENQEAKGPETVVSTEKALNDSLPW